MLGYTFNLTGPTGVQEIVDSNLASAMVLTPLGAAMAGIALVISLVAVWRRDVKVIPRVRPLKAMSWSFSRSACSKLTAFTDSRRPSSPGRNLFMERVRCGLRLSHASQAQDRE